MHSPMGVSRPSGYLGEEGWVKWLDEVGGWSGRMEWVDGVDGWSGWME